MIKIKRIFIKLTCIIFLSFGLRATDFSRSYLGNPSKAHRFDGGCNTQVVNSSEPAKVGSMSSLIQPPSIEMNSCFRVERLSTYNEVSGYLSNLTDEELSALLEQGKMLSNGGPSAESAVKWLIES